MLILSLDSCGSSCGVGVFRDADLLSRAEESMERGQDARLMPMIVARLADAKCDFSDLDRITVTRGPGSFTGLRVGLAAARGIGLAAKKPVIGINRFLVYKSLHASPKNLLVVINSKRAELYCQYFPHSGEVYVPTMMTDDEIHAFMAAHPGTDIAGDIATPNADVLGVSARLGAEADPKNPDFRPRPFYLRAPDVTFPK